MERSITSDQWHAGFEEQEKQLSNGQSNQLPRPLVGVSWANFAQRKIDHTKTLLGNRYLCKHGGLFIVAPSGQGKSTLCAQCSICFAVGWPCLDIKPSRPLRSVIIQAEDDEGDCIEMAQIAQHLKLSQAQMALMEENTHVEPVNDLTGQSFFHFLEFILTEKAPVDLVWINPYTAYLGGDIKDDKLNSNFLRNQLNPILTRHDCAAIPIHHTPKTNFRDTENWKPSDWMYAGAGATVLTNWARAYLVIDPCKTPGLFKFIAAKRGKRIGWNSESCERFFAHSQDEQRLWIPASNELINTEKKASAKTPDDLLPLIPALDPIPKEELTHLANQKGFGINKIEAFLKILLNQEKIFRHKIPTPSAPNQIAFSKSRPSQS